MEQKYSERIEQVKEIIKNADCILIGAGAGLSTAAGFDYEGDRFKKNFKEFIEKYGITNMYLGGFYPFKTAEEKWAYWSKYVYVNRYNVKSNPTYLKLHKLVKNKKYFIITTNVDHQFQFAGFDKKNLFYMQGDFGLFQCSIPCHNKTYDNYELIKKMVDEQKDCKIPSSLIPKCPVCKSAMEMNLRSDDKFIQDSGWFEHSNYYLNFLNKSKNKKLVLLEIGVGYNTPAIIKFPFEEITFENKKARLIRINLDYAIVPNKIKNQTICFNEDVNTILDDLLK